jgi:two-component system, NarL family, sensor kinase
MPTNQSNIITVVTIGIMLALFFVTFIIILMILYQKRQNAFKREISFMKKDYDLQLNNTQVDAQENILSEISQKLHHEVKNNIDAVTMQIRHIAYKLQNDDISISHIKNELENIASQNDFVKQQVRLTSHSLMPERIEQIGLIGAIENEIIKFEKSCSIETILTIDYTKNYELEQKESILVFRLLQETLSNILNHANASVVKVNIGIENNMFFITITDDGVGFNINEKRKNKSTGIGLTDLRRRAEYINAQYNINSKLGFGTTTELRVPYHANNLIAI